jgi:hypothetical protein
MMHLTNVEGKINLQATLSASSAISDVVYQPHHPITCVSELRFYEDGRLECVHAKTEPQDLRTQYCVDHSIALLLIEEAMKQYG